jgi:hypothetical protein
VARQGNSKTARPRDKSSFRGSPNATSCGLPRSSPCVGFCVVLARNLPLSRGQPRLYSILLGELRLFLKVAARVSTTPQDDASRSAAWSVDGDAIFWCDAPDRPRRERATRP